MDAVAYVRVSSKAQSHSMQKAAIELAAKARGDQVVRWYADKPTGGTLAREGLERLRADARAGKLGKVYVYRLDRLTRSGIRDTLEVVEELRTHGCPVASVADGFHLEGPAAEVVLAVLSWAAKMERLAINERISGARARVEAEGRSWGRPRTMTEVQVRRARELAAEGLSSRQIASKLQVARTTLRRSLAEGR
jgi:DNA invertase Pin-like site-specific DNA recombinase